MKQLLLIALVLIALESLCIAFSIGKSSLRPTVISLAAKASDKQELEALQARSKTLFDKLLEDIDITRNVFCNVELNCTNIEAIGFDMDFTLAQYNQEFDLLAFEGAKQKLVENLNYPEEVLNFEYK
jgi:hypothetical protein